MTTSEYKGFTILAWPYQLSESKHWTVDLKIRRNGRSQVYSANEWYRTEQEAGARCSDLGRRIIDGGVPGWSVDYLRGAPRDRRALVHVWKGESMRQYLLAGIVLLSLGAFLLLGGANFASRHEVLRVGDVRVTADERQAIPLWGGGAAMLVGVALVVAGARKRA